jgi:hypothetical protein
MRAYVLSRLAQTVLVVFLSLSAVFVMVRLSGDPVLLFVPTKTSWVFGDEPLKLAFLRMRRSAVAKGDVKTD